MKRIIDLKEGDIIHVLDIVYGVYNQYIVDDVIPYISERELDLFIHRDSVDNSDEMLRLDYTGCHSDHYILYDERKSKRLLSISTSEEKMKSVAWEFTKVSLSTANRLIELTEMTSEELEQENYKFF